MGQATDEARNRSNIRLGAPSVEESLLGVPDMPDIYITEAGDEVTAADVILDAFRNMGFVEVSQWNSQSEEARREAIDLTVLEWGLTDGRVFVAPEVKTAKPPKKGKKKS